MHLLVCKNQTYLKYRRHLLNTSIETMEKLVEKKPLSLQTLSSLKVSVNLSR